MMQLRLDRYFTRKCGTWIFLSLREGSGGVEGVHATQRPLTSLLGTGRKLLGGIYYFTFFWFERKCE